MVNLNDIILDKEVEKVAFFHSHLFWLPHFETELEIMNLFLEQNKSIISYGCNGILSGCDQNFNHSYKNCLTCKCKRYVGLDLIDFKIKAINVEIKKHSVKLGPLKSLDNVKNIYHKNFDVGFAAVSSIVSFYRNPYLDLKPIEKKIEELIFNGIGLYEFFIESLKNEKPNLVFIFNGRFLYTRALLRACESLGIRYYTHDRGSTFNKYMLYENCLPHNINNVELLIKNHWNNKIHTVEEKTKLAEEFFTNKIKGIPMLLNSFVTNQNFSVLPDGFNLNYINFSIFMSSEDELYSIDDSRSRLLFNSQIEGVEFICNLVYKIPNSYLYVRMHPNSHNDNVLLSKLKKFQTPRVIIIPPDSKVSSYNLLFNSNKVIVFGSTIGVEACFWEKPCINLDNSYYQNLNATYNPTNILEIEDLLMNENLKPKPKEGAVIYGYYQFIFGYKFKFYKPESLHNGQIEGINIKKLTSIKFLIKYIYFKFIKL
jgi:hypothetical protein